MFVIREPLSSPELVETWRALAPVDLGPFVRPEWVAVWRRHFGRRSELLMAAASEGSASLPWGMWAVELHESGVLEQVGGREVTDYAAPAVEDGNMERFAIGLGEMLASDEIPWKRLHFEAVPADIGFHAPLADELAARSITVSLTFDEVCPVVELPDTFSEYMARLTRKHRHELRRKLRRFESEAGRPEIETSTPERLEADLEQFFEWHKDAKGPKGGFLDLGYRDFFRDVAVTGAEHGWLKLTYLSAGGVRFSSCFGFEVGNTYFLYNSAHEPKARELSPGIVHVAMLIENGIERGLERFDFLQGNERYKLELGGVPRSLVTMDASRT